MIQDVCSNDVKCLLKNLYLDLFLYWKMLNVLYLIWQGMGYLHERGIIHKDFKSKNIFLENGRVIITDFGLFNAARLCHNSR